MNPFFTSAKVRNKIGTHRNGTVIYVMCGRCEKCQFKQYEQCNTDPAFRDKVLAVFEGDQYSGRRQRFRFNYEELEFESNTISNSSIDTDADNISKSVGMPKLNSGAPKFVVKKDHIFIHKDIKAIAAKIVDIPLIENECTESVAEMFEIPDTIEDVDAAFSKELEEEFENAYSGTER